MKIIILALAFFRTFSLLQAQRPPLEYKLSYYSSQGSEVESTKQNAELNEVTFEAPIFFRGFNKNRHWLSALEFDYTSSSLEIGQNSSLDLHRIRFPFLFVHRPLGNSEWAPTAFIVPIFAGDSIDFNLDQFFISGLIGAQKKYSNGVELTLGALYLETQGEPLLVPAFALKYAFAEYWELEWRGPRLKLTRQQDNLTLGLTVENNGRIWHIDDINQELSFNQLQIGGLMDLKLNDHSSVKLKAGANILGSFDTLKDRTAISEESLTSGFFFSTQYTLTF